jgi:CheY-like chemotaxis protein
MTPGSALVDSALTAKAVRALRRFQTERVLLGNEWQRPSVSFAVTASAALVKSAAACTAAAQEWGVDAVLVLPLRKNELLLAALRSLRDKAQDLPPAMPLSTSWDDSVLRKRSTSH